MKIAVYTTYCGVAERATLKTRVVGKKYPHYLLSNNQYYLDVIPKSTGWNGVYMDMPISDNFNISSLQSKFAKALPHRFDVLNQYDYLFYVDDKISLNEDIIEDLVYKMEKQQSMLGIRKHLYYTAKPLNILYEFGESMYQLRYRLEWEKAVSYITEQVKDGLNLEADNLFMSGALLRNMKHPEIKSFNETWYEHILKCGICCQISIHFTLQKYKNIFILPNDLEK